MTLFFWGERPACLIRWVVESPLRGHWELSSGGRAKWENLGQISWPSNIVNDAVKPAERVKGFVGRFDAWADEDILSFDVLTRTTRI